MLILLFGLAGSGKNFVGKILAREFDYYFWDADEALSAEMRECIRHNQTYTQSMRDRFTIDIIENIVNLSKEHQKLVVAQALYKEINRQMIYERFPNVLFIHVQAAPEVIHKRLRERKCLVNEIYAEKIKAGFEEPRLKHAIIINNQDETAITEQIKRLFNNTSS